MSRRLLYGSLVVVLLPGAAGTWLFLRQLTTGTAARHAPPPRPPREPQNLLGRRLTVREFNRNRKLTFSLVADRRQKLARQFGGDDVIPRTYVIDRAGVVVHQAIGYSENGFTEIVSAIQRAAGVTPSPAAPSPL